MTERKIEESKDTPSMICKWSLVLEQSQH